MKVPFAYFGGKAGLARDIVGLMPAHRVYIEPFLGSGAVLLAKGPAAHEIVNDADGALVAFWRCLRDRRDELEEVCALTPHSRAEFVAADCDDTTVDDLELARRFWVRVNQSFAKTAGTRTGWSVTTARTQSVPASIFSRLGRFEEIARRLANVTIECCDAAGLIERLATHDAVVYVDPPYLGSTRSGRSETSPAEYRVDMMSIEAHERLAEVLHATDAVVLLSGYRSPSYDGLYGGWWSKDFNVTVHSSNSQTVDRAHRVETVWSNRNLDEGRLF